ncbi:hypothetical protein WG75_11855 [Citromicrobium sp. WPS32]|nr:hypothetical protein WG75_11855 [Citromicrobium sp. WPS32]
MRRLIVAAAVALAGCTTTQLQEKDPVLTTTSIKSPEALEECIGLAFARTGRPSTIRGEDKRIMAWGSGAVTMLTVTIKYGAPNVIELRSNSINSGSWMRDVSECAE